jgi:uncharacterized protein YcbK (DUF882 family)
MMRLVAGCALALALSGCFPLAFFAQTGPAYRAYGQSLGTFVSNADANAVCLSPKLRFVLWDFEGYFGKKVVLSSGYRDPIHNVISGGKEQSFHMRCMAADLFIPGVPKDDLIRFAYNNGAVGGLGCYPGKGFIHVDVRDRPAGRQRPVTFSGC